MIRDTSPPDKLTLDTAEDLIHDLACMSIACSIRGRDGLVGQGANDAISRPRERNRGMKGTRRESRLGTARKWDSWQPNW